MNSNLKLVSVFVGGLVTGGALTAFFLEGKIRTKYEMQLESMKRVYGQINTPTSDEDGDSEDSRETVRSDAYDPSVGVTRDPEYASDEPVVDNAYHRALDVVETPVEVFVEGGINDYGMSYIEEEEFLDEDGRAKVHVDYFVQNADPIFLIDGQQIDNWDELLGDSILVDMYRHAVSVQGLDPVLYVRNHKTGTDYEVVQISQEGP